jgi:hypothetical protein
MNFELKIFVHFLYVWICGPNIFVGLECVVCFEYFLFLEKVIEGEGQL